ncbi:MAG: 5-oxopent-3-ene,2,5-tricarboxylate decarboxylase [Ramlibacter sp.]|nr:5-oxopent-3-ene,2,5-tricarboxylate decarboxylase [Ramlibacter sp.]
MKFATFHEGNETRLGVLVDDGVIDLNRADPSVPPDLRRALAQGIDLLQAGTIAMRTDARRIPLAEIRFAPVVPEPGKIICLGLNYADHAKEGGRARPDYPWFFLRTPGSLIGHRQPALRPRVSGQLDYEAELAVIIGKRVKHVQGAQALAAVFGYSCFNDISVRDYQKRTPQWTIGKNFDGTGAFGPWAVSADELPAGGAGLRIEARLNGEVMQSADTRDMLFGVEETLALLSECMTLEPADVVVMGTPAGVGAARSPPLWMKDGDTVEVEIERIGLLANPVCDEAGQSSGSSSGFLKAPTARPRS